ncbi:MAG: GLPGLI family protein, partial [Bacteroidota bacterium]
MKHISTRNIFVTFLLMAIAITGIAQVSSGTIKYKVTHNWVKKVTAVEYMSQATKDHYNYVWGNRSEYEEYYKFIFSPSASRYEQKNDGLEDSEYNFSWRSDEYIIYRNLGNKTSYDLMRYQGKLYVIEDSIHNQNWKIRNDVREIAGHICMNAYWRDTIKMNDVMAWFALDIPVSAGPESYGGLPGLILEINVNNGAMIISTEK